VLLGDTGLPGMTQPLTAGAFGAPDRLLRIWFSTSPGGPFSLLTPDRVIASAPFALVAETAADAARLGGQGSSYYQARVGGTCAPGSTVQTVNVDGSVTCQTVHDDRPVFSLTSLDVASVGVGLYTSITIGADGLGLISYYDGANTDLKVAHCSNTACTAAAASTLDSVGNVGQYTSITIGADGLGLISYYDYDNGDLKVAHCLDTACTSADLYTLDSSSAGVGGYTSITIGADGLALISYYDFDNGDLKVAHCQNTACTSADLYTLDDASAQVGWYTSITIGVDGLGLISYYDYTNGDLKVAHCQDTACTSADTYPLDSASVAGLYTSITIGADGLGLISYYDSIDGDLRVAHCNDTGCTGAALSTLDTGYSVGWYTSITTGADGLGLISYFDFSNGNLKLAHCSNVTCSSATTYKLDNPGDVGRYTSITIGSDGLGLISYFDQSNFHLKVAHLSNAFGTPWVRRR
jgi:preprotein translocase subunit Sec61beta